MDNKTLGENQKMPKEEIMNDVFYLIILNRNTYFNPYEYLERFEVKDLEENAKIHRIDLTDINSVNEFCLGEKLCYLGNKIICRSCVFTEDKFYAQEIIPHLFLDDIGNTLVIPRWWIKDVVELKPSKKMDLEKLPKSFRITSNDF